MAVASRATPGAIVRGPNEHAGLIQLGGRQFWSTGGRVIAFIEEMCVFTNGRWTGQPFALLPWQKRLLWELFEIDPETGLRRFRRALIGTPRKNGKTELAAALALYFLLADGEKSAEIYCAAASEEQADRVFMAARRMAEFPALAEYVAVPEGAQADYLTSKADGYSLIRRLTAKGRTKHGLNIHAVIKDEVHAWGVGEQEELWAALSTGMAARLQPMEVAITTAGADLQESRCGALYEYGRALERGELADDGFFFRWWSAPEDCDYRNPAMWRIANPSYGVTITEDFLRGEIGGDHEGDARRGAVSEAEFRRLYLNQWVDYGETPWVLREQITACRVEEFNLRAEQPAWVGIDLSEGRDSTAVCVAQWWEEGRPCGHAGEPCLYLLARVWDRPRGLDGRPLEGWRVPQGEVKQHLRDLNAAYAVQTNVFDPWHTKLLRQDLEADGLHCEEIWQTGARRSGASAQLYDLIVQGRLHYCDDSFERHVMNATAKATGTDGGYYLSRRRGGKPMDAAMAAVNVVYGTLFAPATAAANVYFL